MSLAHRRLSTIALASALAAGALIAPSMASAKTVKFKVKAPAKTAGTVITGKFSGTFGKGKVTGVSTPPRVTTTLHAKGGKIILKTEDGHIDGAYIIGTFTMSGTGKYKKIKGKGKLKAPAATQVFTFTGTAKY